MAPEIRISRLETVGFKITQKNVSGFRNITFVSCLGTRVGGSFYEVEAIELAEELKGEHSKYHLNSHTPMCQQFNVSLAIPFWLIGEDWMRRPF